MKAILFSFSFLLLTLGAIPPHPIYVTLLEVKHLPDDRKLSICVKVFTDDLEDGLIGDGAPLGMSLKTDSVHPHADTYLEQYFRKKIAFKANGKTAEHGICGQ